MPATRSASKACSTESGDTFSPARLITSLNRPQRKTRPSSSTRPLSPVRSHPPVANAPSFGSYLPYEEGALTRKAPQSLLRAVPRWYYSLNLCLRTNISPKHRKEDSNVELFTHLKRLYKILILPLVGSHWISNTLSSDGLSPILECLTNSLDRPARLKPVHLS